MRVIDALYGINKPRYGVIRVVDREEKYILKENLDEVIKLEIAISIAKSIVESDKLHMDIIKDSRGDEEYRAEVYVLNRKDIETLIENVRQDTIMRMKTIKLE